MKRCAAGARLAVSSPLQRGTPCVRGPSPASARARPRAPHPTRTMRRPANVRYQTARAAQPTATSRISSASASASASAATATATATAAAAIPRCRPASILPLDSRSIRSPKPDPATARRARARPAGGRSVAYARPNPRQSKTSSIDHPIVQKFTCSQSTYALSLNLKFCYIPTQPPLTPDSSPAPAGRALTHVRADYLKR